MTSSDSKTSKSETSKSENVALVLFGITGDLGEKKLFPAIVELARAGLLNGPVIGVGRSEYSDDDLWTMLVEATDESARDLRSSLDLSYFRGDSTEADTYSEIADRVEGQDQVVVYTALPPSLFAGVAEHVGSSMFADRVHLVLEKPFGNDRASACELFSAITEAIGPDRVFAVDHFLAKAEVEHLARFRYRNPLIDAAFDRHRVDRIEVTMAEAFGVDGRGSFYDSVGALRDVVQNHLLQLVAVLLMEQPVDDSPAALGQARADLLGSILPLDPEDVILGQFEGYRDIEGVDDDSTTETFVGATLRVDNDRWRGVDVHLRTGKELEASVTEVVVCLGANRIRFGIKPDPTIVLELDVAGDPTELTVCGPRGHGPLGDYATMLAGAMAGNHRHFARIADIERAWEIVDPVLDRDQTPAIYPRGSTGPTTTRPQGLNGEVPGETTCHDRNESMNESPETPTPEILTAETLTIVFPARSRFLSLARVNAASMAASGGFDVDELDDIRLAVGEAIGWLLHDEAAGGTVSIDYETSEDSFSLRAERTGSGIPANEPDDLVDAILGAILDHHELGIRPDGERWVELKKERSVLER